MKFLTVAVVFTALSGPAFSQVASHSQVQLDPGRTRAQVREEFVKLKNAGYDPQDKTDYPTNLIRAESNVAQQANSSTTHTPASNGSAPIGK